LRRRKVSKDEEKKRTFRPGAGVNTQNCGGGEEQEDADDKHSDVAAGGFVNAQPKEKCVDAIEKGMQPARRGSDILIDKPDRCQYQRVDRWVMG